METKKVGYFVLGHTKVFDSKKEAVIYASQRKISRSQVLTLVPRLLSENIVDKVY